MPNNKVVFLWGIAFCLTLNSMEVAQKTIALSSFDDLNAAFVAEGLAEFVEKTNLATKLSLQQRSPLAVVVAVDFALNDYCLVEKDLLKVEKVYEKRAALCTCILKEHSQAVAALKETGLLDSINMAHIIKLPSASELKQKFLTDGALEYFSDKTSIHNNLGGKSFLSLGELMKEVTAHCEHYRQYLSNQRSYRAFTYAYYLEIYKCLLLPAYPYFIKDIQQRIAE